MMKLFRMRLRDFITTGMGPQKSKEVNSLGLLANFLFSLNIVEYKAWRQSVND